MQRISEAFSEHYTKKLEEHGPTAAGVDWVKEDTANQSYHYCSKLFLPEHVEKRITVLDIGCGYGGFLTYAKQLGLEIDYTGIDIVSGMTDHGKKMHPEAKFMVGDFLEIHDVGCFDYVICNGAMTIKLQASILDMHRYADAMIRKLYAACQIGMAFNIMTNRVNFQIENSYYRSPVETLAFCLSELSDKVIVDHNHPRYQFWTYVYR